MKVLYTAKATAHGGREGQVKSSDEKINLSLQMPKELGGKDGPGTNPEQLFAAGYAACFESALRLAARTKKLPFTDATVTAEVDIGTDNSGGFGLGVRLSAVVSGVDQATAELLVEAAHQVCPYSKATRGNITVDLSASAN